MAVQVSRVWSDLDHRFTQDALGNLKVVTNVASVMTSIDNILRTYRGERVMLPTFASRFRGLLFEGLNATTMKFLSKEVKDEIEKWDSRVSIQTVSVQIDPDYSSVALVIDFNIVGQENIYQYEGTFKRG